MYNPVLRAEARCGEVRCGDVRCGDGSGFFSCSLPPTMGVSHSGMPCTSFFSSVSKSFEACEDNEACRLRLLGLRKRPPRWPRLGGHCSLLVRCMVYQALCMYKRLGPERGVHHEQQHNNQQQNKKFCDAVGRVIAQQTHQTSRTPLPSPKFPVYKPGGCLRPCSFLGLSRALFRLFLFDPGCWPFIVALLAALVDVGSNIVL